MTIYTAGLRMSRPEARPHNNPQCTATREGKLQATALSTLHKHTLGLYKERRTSSTERLQFASVGWIHAKRERSLASAVREGGHRGRRTLWKMPSRPGMLAAGAGLGFTDCTPRSSNVRRASITGLATTSIPQSHVMRA